MSVDRSVTHRTKQTGLRGFALLLALALLAGPVHAQPGNDARERNELKELRSLNSPSNGSRFAPQPGVGLEQATQIARRHTGGRVLSATPLQRSSGTEYRVRMLVDGERVVTVTVDASGQVKKKRR